MNNEYIVINKTELLKVMENNKKEAPHHDGIYVSEAQDARVELIEEILSQSTPLNPLLENTFDAGYKTKQQGILMKKIEYTQQKQEYISNLKLDI